MICLMEVTYYLKVEEEPNDWGGNNNESKYKGQGHYAGYLCLDKQN